MNEREFIRDILTHIHPEKDVFDQIDDKAFESTDELVKSFPDADLAELVYQNTLGEINIKKISGLFDMLIWSTLDNGAALTKTTQKWFNGNDKRKIEIVLNMTESYPVYPFDKLRPAIERLRNIFPEFKELLDYWDNARVEGEKREKNK